VAQERNPHLVSADLAVQRLENTAGRDLAVVRSQLTGLVTFMSAGPRQSIQLSARPNQSAGARSLAFLTEYGTAFGIQNPSQLRIIGESYPDEAGTEHVRLQQIHNEIPVTAGELIIHLKGTSVTAVSARTLPVPDSANSRPAVQAEQALARARLLVEEQLGHRDVVYSQPRLEIFNRGLLEGIPQPTRLAWFISARNTERREFLWVDAVRGEVLLHFNQLAQELNRSIYSSLHSLLLPGTLIRRESDTGGGDADAEDAYKYAGDAYDYFFREFGRDGYDGNGAPMLTTIHYGSGYRNAFWNGEQTVFGDGFSQADDVVVHEWTHALTEYTAGLYYYMQSGALNESFSDIFGETVDLLNESGNDSPGVRWQQGEDLPGGPSRDLMNPPAFKQPGKVSDSEFFKCNPSEDRGGVHGNSGILNHAYALMVDGGSYNGFTIHGIGLTKAAHIMYRTLTSYLTQSADFLDAYNAINQASNDLIGTGRITPADAAEVKKALDAVELSAPWPCTPRQPVVPELCSAGCVPLTLFYDDLESINSSQWVARTLSGLNHWTGGEGSEGLYWSGFASTGVYHFWGYNESYVVDSDSAVEMTRDVLIPTQARMQLHHSYGFEIEGARYSGGGVVEYSADGGTTWNDAGSLIAAGALYNGTTFGRSAFVGSSYGYTASQLDLATLAGKAVRFRFRMLTLGSNPFYGDQGWFIDDIRIFQAASQFTLTVVRSGGGTGTVSSSPAGIQCGSACSKDFSPGNTVILMAVADENSVFTGWKGACTGTGSCNVTLDQFRYVIAEFAPRDCRVTLSALNIIVDFQERSGSASVAAPGGCSWTSSVDPSSSWITLTTGGGSGTGVVRFQVTANPFAGSRKGSITIGDQALTIIQEGKRGWTRLGPEGGIVYSIAASRSNPEIVYAGTSQGIYKSSNRGVRWERMNNGLSVLDVRALAVDPADPETVYAGTHGGGVFKSRNGGQTWSSRNDGLEGHREVHSLAIDPQDSTRLYLGTSGIFVSRDRGETWRKAGGFDWAITAIAICSVNPQIIYISTRSGVIKSSDGGTTWLGTYPASFPFSEASSLAVHPSNPDVVLAGRYPSGIQRSTDGGITWNLVSSPPASAIYTFTFDPVQREILYAGTWGDGIHKSTDGGLTWSVAGSQPDNLFVRQLILNPGNPTILYAATHGGGVFKSANGGQEWKSQRLESVEVQVLRTDPKDPRIIFAGTSVGIFKSLDGGLTWQSINRGLTQLDVRALAIRPDDSNILYAGTYGSKIFKSEDGGLHWISILSPFTGEYSAVDNIVIAPTAPDHLYVSGISNNVFRSFDGGASWIPCNTGFARMVAVDPTDSQIVYATGSFNFYKSTDGGVSWKESRQGLSGSLSAYFLVVDPNHSRTLYLTDYWDKTLYRSVDGAESWVGLNTDLPGSRIATMAFNPAAGNLLYAGTDDAGVFQSSDRGSHWTPLNEGLTNLKIRDLIADPIQPGLLYAGTWGEGVFRIATRTECESALSPTNADYGSEGGVGSVQISAGPDCFWSASSSHSWIVLTSGDSGKGAAVVSFQIAPNPDSETRTGSLVIAGWSFVVTQTGTTLTLSPPMLPGAAKGTFYEQALTAGGGQEPYRYERSSGTLPPGLLLSPSGVLSGTPSGPGQFQFAITAIDASGQSVRRDYSLEAKTVCSFVLSSTASYFDSDGGAGVFDISTASGCSWAIKSDTKYSWIFIPSGKSGQGESRISFSVAPNVDLAPRTALLLINGQRFTIHQKGASRWVGLGPDHSQVGVLAIHPVNPEVLYAGTGRGLFKSTDRGTHWTPCTRETAPLVHAIAIDPLDDQIVYASRQEGLHKSTDGGRSWRPIQKGLPFTPLALAIHPTNPKIVFAGGLDVFKTTDGGENWLSLRALYNEVVRGLTIDPTNPDIVYAATSSGLFKSTNGGESWLRLQPFAYQYPFSLAMDPADPRILYVGTWWGLYKSLDGGQTASLLSTASQAAVSVAVAPANRNLVFAVFEGRGLFRSTDGGLQWTRTASEHIRSDEAIRAERFPIAIDPQDPNLVYVGSSRGLSVSKDGGLTWTAGGMGLPRSIVHAVKVHPKDPNTIFAGTYLDGLYRSRDGGLTWQNVFLTKDIRSVFAVTFDPVNPETVYIGTENGPYQSIDGGTKWNMIPNTLGGFGLSVYSLAVDPVNRNTLYIGTYGGGVLKSIDAGKTWRYAGSELIGRFPVYSLAIDATDHDLLYAGSWHGVHKSIDAGKTWQASNQGLTDLHVKALAMDPLNPRILYAGTSYSGVFKSIDGGATWRSSNMGLTDTSITALALDPKNPRQVYAGTLTHGVFRSSNGGDGWSPMEESEAMDLRTLSLEMDPTNPTLLYAGTDGGGVFRSEDALPRLEVIGVKEVRKGGDDF
jgi:Zn-dependent metalloprotease/photosystem II stability/assembly factor-like uncharacterized protein